MTSAYIAPRKILSIDEMNLVRDASDHLRQLQNLSETQSKQVEEAKAQAYSQGFDEGYREGAIRAFEDLSSAIAMVRSRLRASEGDLFAILMTALEQLVGSIDQEDMARLLLARALRDAEDNIAITIVTSIEEQEAIRQCLEPVRLDPDIPEIQGVEADPLLKPGEMLLRTPKGNIHIGLKHQLNQLRNAAQGLEIQR